ncbi:unnamed protein product, partial [Brachionus calyciflorus]
NNSGIISSKISLDIEKNSLIIEYDQNLSEFALECSICLRNENKADVEKDFNLKQIIENFKLKVSQELNKLNRYLKKAESNYYDTYRVYIQLKNSPMSSILVNMYKNGLNFNDCDGTNDNVFDAIINYYDRTKLNF